MSGEEIKKYRIVTEYIEDRLTRKEAAEKLNMTETNVSRRKKKLTEVENIADAGWESEMRQLDTSPHDWLGTGEKLHLIVIVGLQIFCMRACLIAMTACRICKPSIIFFENMVYPYQFIQTKPLGFTIASKDKNITHLNR